MGFFCCGLGLVIWLICVFVIVFLILILILLLNYLLSALICFTSTSHISRLLIIAWIGRVISALIIANNRIDAFVIIVSEFSIWLSGMCEYTIVIIFGRQSARKMIVIISGYSLITVFPSLIMLFIMSFEPAYFAEYSVNLDDMHADITADIIMIIDI